MSNPLDYARQGSPESRLPAEARALTIRRSMVIALAALGVLVMGLLPPTAATGADGRVWFEFGMVRWSILTLLIGLAFVPAVHRPVFAALERLRRPDPDQRRRRALIAAILAGLYFIWTAYAQGRDFFPKTHDEQSYLLQMRMLAQGRLWHPAHELADFFETFHVAVEPVYASIYFPGTAMMYVAGLWLGWPVWLLPVMASAACVGLLYSIVTELVDGLAGALAALVLASLSWFRMLSILLMAQVPAMLLGLLMFWAFLRWRESRGQASDEPIDETSAVDGRAARRGRAQWGWAAAIGALAGWMAITRPVDAVCYALPVGLGILWALYRGRDAAGNWMATLGLIVVAATPFLALQAAFNKAVTGSYTQTPFEYYINRDQPQTSFGFHDFDPAVRPVSTLPQKQALYDYFVVPRARNHTPAQLPITWAKRYAAFTLDVPLPARPLIVLLPVGLLGLAGARRAERSGRWVLWATLPLFVCLYALYTFYLEHYIVVVAPAVILTLVLAMRAMERAWPDRRPTVVTGSALAIVFVCIASLPDLTRGVTDESMPSPMLRALREVLPNAIPDKAVVLVRWAPGADPARNYHQEPVYNTATAWPDDARIIFAHDLGEQRNVEIFRYYAQHQPERRFYLFDRSKVEAMPEESIVELGTAAELAARAAAGGG